jgi:hypothetical protein
MLQDLLKHDIKVSTPQEIIDVVEIFKAMGAIHTWNYKDHEDLEYIRVIPYLPNIEIHGGGRRAGFKLVTYTDFTARYDCKSRIILRKLNASKFTKL